MHVRRTSAARTSPNKILASLPAADFRRLSPALQPISLPFQHVLLEPGEIVRTIYFLGDGVCSITQTMRNRQTVEVASVGREGFIGINALFGDDRAIAGALMK